MAQHELSQPKGIHHQKGGGEMLNKKRRAASGKATPKDSQQNKYYQQGKPKSTIKLKEQLGKLLLYLFNPFLSEAEKHQGWQLFRTLLKKYQNFKRWEVTR